MATDRFRLAVRSLRAVSAAGEPARVLVPAVDLEAAAAWAKGFPDVAIEVDEHGARLRAAGGERPLELVSEAFPDYRAVLARSADQGDFTTLVMPVIA